MTSTILRSTVAAIAFAGAIAFATPSMAAMMNFKANLDAKSEVPPNRPQGTGTVTATYDTASKKLTWKGSYNGLTGPATAAHFHGPAASRQERRRAGSDRAGHQPARRLGDANRRPGQGADGRRMYVNVHTAANKGGEIRGQLTK